jgi:hypothetical protein
MEWLTRASSSRPSGPANSAGSVARMERATKSCPKVMAHQNRKSERSITFTAKACAGDHGWAAARSGRQAAGTMGSSAAQRSGWRSAKAMADSAPADMPADGDTLDPHMVEQFGEGVRLVVGAGIVGIVGAEIAEARGRDDAVSGGDEGLREHQPLVEAAAAAMHHQQRQPVALFGIFHPAEAGLRRAARNGRKPLARRRDGGGIAQPQSARSRRQQRDEAAADQFAPRHHGRHPFQHPMAGG